MYSTPSCCVFRPAFGCCAHPKAGQNIFFRRFSTFLFISKLFHWFQGWNQWTKKVEKWLKKCFDQLSGAASTWRRATCKATSSVSDDTSRGIWTGDYRISAGPTGWQRIIIYNPARSANISLQTGPLHQKGLYLLSKFELA